MIVISIAINIVHRNLLSLTEFGAGSPGTCGIVELHSTTFSEPQI